MSLHVPPCCESKMSHNRIPGASCPFCPRGQLTDCVWLWERTCRKCCLLSQNKPGCSLQNGWVDLAYICHCDWFIRCIFSETNVHFNWSLDCVELNRNWMLAVSTARRRNAAFDASQKWEVGTTSSLLTCNKANMAAVKFALLV